MTRIIDTRQMRCRHTPLMPFTVDAAYLRRLRYAIMVYVVDACRLPILPPLRDTSRALMLRHAYAASAAARISMLLPSPLFIITLILMMMLMPYADADDAADVFMFIADAIFQRAFIKRAMVMSRASGAKIALCRVAMRRDAARIRACCVHINLQHARLYVAR